MRTLFSAPIALLISLAPVALASNHPGRGSTLAADNQAAEPTREEMAAMHRKMSKVHGDVADCLESNRPLSECRQLMTTECSTMRGNGGMGMHHHGHPEGMMSDGWGMHGCPMMGTTHHGPADSKAKAK